MSERVFTPFLPLLRSPFRGRRLQSETEAVKIKPVVLKLARFLSRYLQRVKRFDRCFFVFG
jgi:hypothetical protein